MRAAQRAMELAPGFALGHLVLGMARLYSGDAAGAIAPLTRGLQLNPFDPQNFVWYNTLAYAHLFAGQAQAALQFAAGPRRFGRTGRPPSRRKSAATWRSAIGTQPANVCVAWLTCPRLPAMRWRR